MNRTDPHETLRQARDLQEDEDTTEGPEIYTCPVGGCGRVVIDNPSNLRNHVRQEVDDAHRGFRLDPSLELVERYKIGSDLREQYVEKRKTQQEIADEWGVGRNTIHRWLKKHGIDRRNWTGTGAWNRVQYASFYTETHENGGYEKVGSYDPELEVMRWTTVHQLTAIADGADPNKVFSNGEYQTHHRTPIPWLNFAENVEVIPRAQHQHAHQRGEWDEKDGLPVLVTGQPLTDEEYHAMWGPGVRSEANEDQEPESHEKKSASNNANQWGPGAPTTDV